MAFNDVRLLVLLLAYCLSVPTLARNLDPSFVQSEGAKIAAGSAGLLVSKKQGTISSSAETGHARGISFDLYHETGRAEKSTSDPKPDSSFELVEEMSLPSLSHAEGISISREKAIEENLLHESELVLHDADTIPSLLDQNGLPIGLLPSSVESYSITDDGDFTVSLQKACYVKFDYEVHYAETITGKLTYGTISNLSGIQAKEAFFWVSVTGIRTDIPSSEYIYFEVGPISKKLSISQFQTIPTCEVKAFSAVD